MTEQEVRVERREIEAARRFVDELDAIRAGIVDELVVDPLHGLLDGRLARHAGPPFVGRSSGPRRPPCVQPRHCTQEGGIADATQTLAIGLSRSVQLALDAPAIRAKMAGQGNW